MSNLTKCRFESCEAKAVSIQVEASPPRCGLPQNGTRVLRVCGKCGRANSVVDVPAWAITAIINRAIECGEVMRS